MRRQEETRKAAQVHRELFYGNESRDGRIAKASFERGAEWADSHLSEATIKKVIDLYKQWYSEQCDKPLALYVQQNWNDNENETPYALDSIMGDVQQDLDDFIDGFINTKNKQL